MPQSRGSNKVMGAWVRGPRRGGEWAGERESGLKIGRSGKEEEEEQQQQQEQEEEERGSLAWAIFPNCARGYLSWKRTTRI
jgi:hypothetical protein